MDSIKTSTPNQHTHREWTDWTNNTPIGVLKRIAELEQRVFEAYELGFSDGWDYGECADDWMRSSCCSKSPEQVWAALEGKQDGAEHSGSRVADGYTWEG